MTFSPRAIEAAKAIDFAQEARDLKQALADNAYPAADGSADIDNHAIPIIEATLRNVAERFLTAALAVDGVALQGWQDISTAPIEQPIDILCQDTDGEQHRFCDATIIDREPHAFTFEDTNGKHTYSPHENGMWPTHWQPLPQPPAASDREERR